MIEASHFDVNEAYAAIDRHRLEDNEPYIYRTSDGGQDLAEDHHRPAPGRLPPDHQGGPEATRPALCRHRAWRVRLVQRRRQLAVAPAQPAGHVDARRRDQGQRSDRGHPRPRVLGARRHDRLAPGHGRSRPAHHLFKPGDAIMIPEPTDDGTPTQKDEAFAENPPTGAIIDYYLESRGVRPGRAGDSRPRWFGGSSLLERGRGSPYGRRQARHPGDLAASAGIARHRRRHASIRLGLPPTACTRRRRAPGWRWWSTRVGSRAPRPLRRSADRERNEHVAPADGQPRPKNPIAASKRGRTGMVRLTC